jgi:hypothetical protein
MNKIMGILLIVILLMAAVVVYSGGGSDPAEQDEPPSDDGGDTGDDGGDEVVVGPTQATVTFDGDSIATIGNGVYVSGTTATVYTSGTYEFSGSLVDGQIIVDAKDSDIVTLVLNGVDIYCSGSAPIYVANAEDVIIVLSEGTENYVRDGETYAYEDASTDEPNAAIFSKDDLLITGGGSLTVTAAYNNGIQSKDDLEITGGSITVTSENDGIKGKDSLVVREAEITIVAGGDGMQSSNSEDEGKGFVTIYSGSIAIDSGEDGIQAETALTIEGGVITVCAGGGSANSSDAKGLKAGSGITISDGAIVVDSADDAIHSNDSIVINGGIFSLATSDDGVHADTSIEINGGDIDVTSSYEGIESALITINNGTIHVASRDDGINVTDGEGNDFMGGGRPGQPGGSTSTGANGLTINGGYIYVDASGDGFDMNGWISMTGGVVIINGPTSSANGALDFDESFDVTGGFIVAVGSAGMAQSPSMTSTQNSANLRFQSTLQAGTMVHVESEAGVDILTFVSAKSFQSVVICSEDLVAGETYNVYIGGTSTGTNTDGLYAGGAYAEGTFVGSFTVN